MDKDTTRAACEAALTRYEAIWAKDNVLDNAHFWQKANQVHSYLRFASIATAVFGDDTTWYRLLTDPQHKFLEEYWKVLDSALAKESYWTDDYGWAGIACLSVAQTLKAKNYDPTHTWTDWRNVGIRCFQVMECGAAKSQGGYPVPDGISNRPLNPDPGQTFLKNTVTNANFMALAMQLYAFLKENPDNLAPVSPYDALQAAYNQYLWFYGWINTPATNPGIPNTGIPYNYYHHLRAPNLYAAMIEERPVAFPPQYTYNPYVNTIGFSPDAVWSGDQGLFLNACALLFTYIGDLQSVLGLSSSVATAVHQNLVKWMREITQGISQALCNSGLDNVLREAPFDLFFNFRGGGDAPDYVCGRGVLARFLSLEATRNVLLAIQVPKDLYFRCFQATAETIYNSKDSKNGNQLSAAWNPNSDHAANRNFSNVWGVTSETHDFSWPVHRDTDDIWNNYCMMTGFDLYGAWLRVSDWYPRRGRETADGKKQQENGCNGAAEY
jgi:hypothetical protein